MKALISVSDKTGVVAFARALHELSVDIISTGGTADLLRTNGIPVTPVQNVTGFPECLDGRVKTLHPHIHAGILARRDKEGHLYELQQLGIAPVDLVVINLYPFKKTVRTPGTSHERIVENIDIGGPTLLRAAAKNYKDVLVITEPADYDAVVEHLQSTVKPPDFHLMLAQKAWNHIAHYDALINDYFAGLMKGTSMPEERTLTMEKVQDLRYGENPHQAAAYYRDTQAGPGAAIHAVQLHGKALSFNNINDMNGAYALCRLFDRPAVVACKHANPCGVGTADTVAEAYRLAYEADPVSIFGGIIVANRPVDLITAEAINKIFIEIVLAPDFTPEALECLKRKKNIRLLKLANFGAPEGPDYDIRRVSGGFLIQSADRTLWREDAMHVPTRIKPTDVQMADARFGMQVVSHLKSNAVAIVKDERTLGLGTGQVNRIWATRQAIDHCIEALGEEILDGACMASDAFFPFDDCVTLASKYGIRTIVHPGGSMRDADSVAVCDKHGMTMIMTGTRHFKH
ncbi:MAG: bifunctional phosphoribosylaminoimidazolecarboxamide formyltransferase/IMP cyclohydrolase [Eubacteriales bacterium]|nr:bifunctional phosphoribosylaminoimidazolecarboxamide formyltransferase/IMP cyclohydrolase [Eubacteriales bacterium]